MNFEIVKTYILSILVLTSLLLTLAIWNYQPNREPLYDNPVFVNEADLGGKEELKRTLIQPNKILFHDNEQYYGFTTPLEGQQFYEEMQDWKLSDYQLSKSQGPPTNNHQVEIIFPNVLPVEIISTLFEIDDEQSLPTWSFERIFISLNEDTSSLQVRFLSIDGQQQIIYNVDKSETFLSIGSYFENTETLVEYIQFGTAGDPIYLQKDKQAVKSLSLAVKSLDESLLISDLFSDLALISPNLGGTYYTDGQRRLSVLQNGRTMEFINPIHSNENPLDVIELLDLSMKNINGHKGWTNDFRLVDINISEEQVQYRMYFDGYPIYSPSDISMIEQEWRNQKLHLYRRPIFSISSLPSGRMTDLPAGTEIMDYLINSPNYQIGNIKDIQIGYKIVSFDDASYSLTLDPTWYMNYDGTWSEVRIDNYDEFMEGRG